MKVLGEGRYWLMASTPQRNYGSVLLNTLRCSHERQSDTSTLKSPKLTKTTLQASALSSASTLGTTKFTRLGKMPPLQLLPVMNTWLSCCFAVFMFSKWLTQITVHAKFQQIQQLWPSNHKHDSPRARSAMVRSTPGSDHRAAEARERVVGEADTGESK